MFEPTDNIPDFGSVPVRRRGGAWTMMRVTRMAYRRTMINFAKLIIVEFLNRRAWDVEAVVDEWLDGAPQL